VCDGGDRADTRPARVLARCLRGTSRSAARKEAGSAWRAIRGATDTAPIPNLAFSEGEVPVVAASAPMRAAARNVSPMDTWDLFRICCVESPLERGSRGLTGGAVFLRRPGRRRYMSADLGRNVEHPRRRLSWTGRVPRPL